MHQDPVKVHLSAVYSNHPIMQLYLHVYNIRAVIITFHTDLYFGAHNNLGDNWMHNHFVLNVWCICTLYMSKIIYCLSIHLTICLSAHPIKWLFLTTSVLHACFVQICKYSETIPVSSFNQKTLIQSEACLVTEFCCLLPPAEMILLTLPTFSIRAKKLSQLPPVCRVLWG